MDFIAQLFLNRYVRNVFKKMNQKQTENWENICKGND